MFARLFGIPILCEDALVFSPFKGGKLGFPERGSGVAVTEGFILIKIDRKN